MPRKKNKPKQAAPATATTTSTASVTPIKQQPPTTSTKQSSVTSSAITTKPSRVSSTSSDTSVIPRASARTVAFVCLRVIIECLPAVDQAHCLFVNHHWRLAVPPDARSAALVAARHSLWNTLWLQGLVWAPSSSSSLAKVATPAKSGAKVAAKSAAAPLIVRSAADDVKLGALNGFDHRDMFATLDAAWTTLVNNLRTTSREQLTKLTNDAMKIADATNKGTDMAMNGGNLAERIRLARASVPDGESSDPLGLTRNLVRNAPATLLSHARYAHWLQISDSFNTWSWNKEQSRLAPLCGVYHDITTGCSLVLLPRLNDDRIPRGCGRFMLLQHHRGDSRSRRQSVWRGKVGFWTMHPSIVSINIYPVCDSLLEGDASQLAWLRLEDLDLTTHIKMTKLGIRTKSNGFAIGGCMQVTNLPSMFFGTARTLVIPSSADDDDKSSSGDKTAATASSAAASGGDDDGWTSVTDSASLALKQRRRVNAARERERKEEEVKQAAKARATKTAAANKLAKQKLKAVRDGTLTAAAAAATIDGDDDNGVAGGAPRFVAGRGTGQVGTPASEALALEKDVKTYWPSHDMTPVKQQQWYDLWCNAVGGAKDAIKALGCRPARRGHAPADMFCCEACARDAGLYDIDRSVWDE